MTNSTRHHKVTLPPKGGRNNQKKPTSGDSPASGVILPVALTLAVQALVSMSAVTIPVFMPVAAVDMNIPPSYVGIFVSLIYVSATLSALVSGYLIRRFGPIFISQICLILCALGLGVTSLASVPMMILGTLIIGAGYGPVTPASSHLLVRTTPYAIMSVVFSIKQTGVPLGGGLAGAVVPLLVVSHGWKMAAWAVAATSIFLSIVLLPFRKQYDSECCEPSRFSWANISEPLKLIIFHRELRQIVIASFFFVTMQLSLVSFIVTYLTEDIGMTLIQAGIILSASQATGIVGRILWGALADRYVKPRRMLGILGIGMAAGALSAAFFSPQWPYPAILTVSALFGAAAIGWNGVYLAEVARLVRVEHAATATGGSLFFTFCGVLIGLPVFSLIVDKTGSYPFGFGIAAIAAFICGLILLFSRMRMQR